LSEYAAWAEAFGMLGKKTILVFLGHYQERFCRLQTEQPKNKENDHHCGRHNKLNQWRHWDDPDCQHREVQTGNHDREEPQNDTEPWFGH
jgi:hypothetical protein